ncbi:hypothetical protein KMA67_13720 [Enterococcus durans]|uniref:glycoside hydrolase family 26 protein n=1 Tax=Enterococcus durans TaxID=53345 RepID=UPI001D0A2A10|nr:glycosyl hydrolase [Enterococcus durans]MCB8506731.1 hypothetical protein [Enterococcus durans]
MKKTFLFLFFMVGIFCLAYLAFQRIPFETNGKEQMNFELVEKQKKIHNGTLFDKNIGIYLDNPSEIIQLEEMPQIIAWFENIKDKPAKTKIKLCQYDYFIPLITLQPKDVPLTDISSGKYDKELKELFNLLLNNCGSNTVLIRFAHEMEWNPNYGSAGWYSWQKEGNSEEYKLAWNYVVSLGREILPNIKFIWSPNRADEYSKSYYPGDNVVDYVGITLNQSGDSSGKYESFEDFYVQGGKKEILESFNKPIIIAEAAYANKDQQAKEEYLKGLFNYFNKDDNIKAIVLFNKGDYNIMSNKRYLDIFYKELRYLNEK